MNLPLKRRVIYQCMLVHEVDIGILTESWLCTQPYSGPIGNQNQESIHSDQHYALYQTPPSSHQGVAIALRRGRFESVKLVHQDLHTPHTIALKVQLPKNRAGNPANLIVIGHYAQPSIKDQCLEELKFFVENIRRDEPGAQVLVAGDLNIHAEEAQALVAGLNLNLARPGGNVNRFYSYRRGDYSSWIDHIGYSGTSGPLTNILDFNLNQNDHVPIMTDLDVEHRPARSNPPQSQIRYQLKKDITQGEIARVLRISSWP